MEETVRHTTVFYPRQQYLGSVYAKALLGASERAGNTELVLAELESFLDDVLARLPPLHAVLESPRVAWEAKQRLLDQALAGKASRELLNFLKVVTRRGRFDCLRAIAQAARQQFNALRGRVRVQVRTATELDQALTRLVKERLTSTLGHDVELEVSVEPDLIGGLVVRVGDTVYDASVASRLRRLKQELVSRSTQQMREQLGRFALAE
jgi:F-type H+-transporting ATPase subunit delta